MRASACVLLGFLAIASVGRAETLSGVVVNSAGMPAGGARVTAAAIFYSPPLRVTTTTDERGAFSVELQPVSGDTKFFLVVRWQNQGAIVEDALDTAGKKVAITGQKLPTVSIRLQPGGRLRGRLLRAEDDGPIAGGRIFLDTGEVLSVDEQGAFEVDGLALSDHSLIPVTNGRARPYVLFDTTLEPDAPLDVRLPRGAVVKGRVTDSQGQAIPGAFVSRASSGMSFTLSGWVEPCAADGSFEYSGLTTGRLFYGLQANARGYQSVDLPSEVDDPAAVIQRDVRLRPSVERPQPETLASVTSAKATDEPAEATKTTAVPSRDIRGKVTGPDDQAVADAVVRHGAYPWDQSVKPTKTNAQGEYVLAGVPGATGAILVIAEGLPPKFVPYTAADTRLDVKFAHGASVRGIVRSTSGAPDRRCAGHTACSLHGDGILQSDLVPRAHGGDRHRRSIPDRRVARGSGAVRPGQGGLHRPAKPVSVTGRRGKRNRTDIRRCTARAGRGRCRSTPFGSSIFA